MIQPLPGCSKTFNLFRSFCRLLATRLQEAEQDLFVNYGEVEKKPDEFFIPDVTVTWAEIKDDGYGGGQGDEPSTIEVHVYSFVKDDPFLVNAQKTCDLIIELLNVAKAEIYDYTSSQQEPQVTGYYFYPRYRGVRKGEGISEIGLKEYIITFEIYNWRDGILP